MPHSGLVVCRRDKIVDADAVLRSSFLPCSPLACATPRNIRSKATSDTASIRRQCWTCCNPRAGFAEAAGRDPHSRRRMGPGRQRKHAWNGSRRRSSSMISWSRWLNTGRAEPLNDVLQAVSWVQQHADEYKLDPRRLVVIGASGGGRLALGKANGLAAVIDFFGSSSRRIRCCRKKDCRPCWQLALQPMPRNWPA